MSVPEEPPDGDFNALVEEEARGRVADARARWQGAAVSGSLSAWSGPVLTFSAHNYYPRRLNPVCGSRMTLTCTIRTGRHGDVPSDGMTYTPSRNEFGWNVENIAQLSTDNPEECTLLQFAYTKRCNFPHKMGILPSPPLNNRGISS